MFFKESYLDPITTRWMKLAARNGGTIPYSTANLVDDFLVRPLKSTGLSNLMVRFNPCVGTNISASLVPLFNQTSVALDVNNNLLTTDYSQTTGWNTDGATKSINTGVQITNAIGGFGLYLRTTQTSDTVVRIAMGTNDVTFTQLYRIVGNRTANGTASAGVVTGVYGGAVAGPHAQASGAPGLTFGLWSTTRSNANFQTIYKNGISQGTSSSAITALAPGFSMLVMGNNNGGTAGQYLEANSKVAGYYIDSGARVAQMPLLYNIIQTFNQKLGRSV